jgi:hypothetical protein
MISIGPNTQSTITSASQGSYAAGSWQTAKSGLTNTRQVAMSSTGQYQIVVSNATADLWLSSDSGINWSALTNATCGLPVLTGSAYWSAGSISASGQHIMLSVYGGSLWYSADYGRTFATSPQATPDVWLQLNGSTIDTMGLSNVTVTGSPSYVSLEQPGFTEQAIRLVNPAGGTASQHLRSAWNGSTNFTISFWFNAQTIGVNYQYIVSAYDGALAFTLNSSNLLYVVIPSGGGTNYASIGPLATISSNTWYYVTLIFQTNNTCSVYVNNTLAGSVTNSQGVGSLTTSSLAIGGFYYNLNTTSAFNGYISDVRLYNSAITYVPVPHLAPNIWLRFEGSTADAGSNAITPSVTGTVSYVPGAIGLTSAYLANEANVSAGTAAANYISIHYTKTTPMAFSLWFRLTSIASSGSTYIVTFTDSSQTISSLELYINNSSSTLFLQFNQVGGIPTGIVVRLNIWYHVYAIYQPSVSFALYVDGQFISALTSGVPSGLSSGPPGNANGRILFGDRRAYSSICPFAGYIDDFRIYNAAIPFYNHIPRNYTHLTVSGNSTYRMAASQLGHLFLSSDSGLTWARQTTTSTPGAWSSLSASHTGKYLTAQSQPLVQPNQSGLSSNTWSQQGVTYIASASSFFPDGPTYPPYGAFNNNYSSAGIYSWVSNFGYSSGTYVGSVSTTVSGIGSVLGEWLQLQVSTPLILQSYTYACGGPGNLPRNYYIVGSNDGSTWFPIQYVAGTTNPLTANFTTCSSYLQVNYNGVQTIIGGTTGSVTTTSYQTSKSSYIYFRVIATSLWIGPYAEFGELYFNFIGGSITPNQSGLTAPSWLNSGVSWLASASSEQTANTKAQYAFNNRFDSTQPFGWGSTSYVYNATTGAYSAGTYSTTIQGGIGTVSGEWLQIQSYIPLLLQSYTYGSGGWFPQMPKNYYIVGSNDGSTWYPLQYVSFTTTPFTANNQGCSSSIIMNYSGIQTIQGGQTGSASTTSYSYTTQLFQYFRIIINTIWPSNTFAGAEIGEWYLNFSAGQNSSSNYGLTWTPTLQTGDAFNVTKNVTVTNSGTGFVTLPSFRPVSQGVTFSAWFTLTDPITQFSRIFDFGDVFRNPSPQNSLHVYFNTNGQITCGITTTAPTTSTASLTSSLSCSIGTLYHFVWTITGSNSHIMYINGGQQAILTSSIGIITYLYNYIGRSNWPDGQSGIIIRDFRMFNRGLNAAEVNALYLNTNYGQPAVGPLSLSGSGSHALAAIGSTALLDGGNYLTAYQASNFAAPLLTGINAPIVATAVSYDGLYMVLVTSGTTNNVYYSTNYGANFTGLTIGSSAMVSCAISYDGSYFTVSNATTTYRLNSNSTGFSIAVGSQAGQVNQAVNAIAIGNKAGQVNQSDNSIILNATGSSVGTGVSGLYVAPIAGAESSASPSLSLLGYGFDNQIVQTGATILALEKGVNGGASTQMVITKGSIQATNYTHHHWNSAKILSSFLVTTGTYWKIATVGPTGSYSCWGTLNIKGSLGGFYAEQQIQIDVSLSTRNGIVVNGQVRSGNLAYSLLRMDLGYVWNGNAYDVYFYTPSTDYISFDLDVSGHQGFTSNVFLYDPSLTSPITQSPGTLTSLITACQIVTNGSNIGIGTTTPGTKCVIYGYTYPVTAANSPSYENYGQLCLTDSTGPSAYPTARGSLKLGYDAAMGSWGAGFIQPVVPNLWSPSLLLCPYSGYVGIGITNPSQRLDVAGSVNCTGLLVNGVAVATGTGSVWSVSGSNITYSSGSVTIGTAVIPNSNSAGTTSLINYGNACLYRNRLIFSNALTDWNHCIYNNGQNNDGEGVWDGLKLNVYAGLSVRVGNANGVTPTTVMYINNIGNVGIGTTNPIYPLHLHNSTSILAQFTNSSEYARIVLNGSSGTGGDLIFKDGGTSRYGIACIASKLQFLLNDSTLTVPVTLDTTGFMGIGTVTPTDGPLCVYNSNATYVTQKITHATSGNWALWMVYGNAAGQSANFILFQGSDGNVRGSITSSGNNTISYTTGSDRRFKENIQPVVNPRSYIDQLKPCSFNMIGSSQESIGFIAQEVKESFPSMVTSGDTPDQYLYLDYSKFSPIAIAGVKQLYEENDKLTARVALLESALADKSAQLDSLMVWAKSQGFSG